MSDITSVCWAVTFAQVLVPALILGISPAFLKGKRGFSWRELDRTLGGLGLAGVAWIAVDILTRHQWTWQMTVFASIMLLWVDLRLAGRLRDIQRDRQQPEGSSVSGGDTA